MDAIVGSIRPALAYQPVAGTKELNMLLGSVLWAIRGVDRSLAGSNGHTPAEADGYQLRGDTLTTPRI